MINDIEHLFTCLFSVSIYLEGCLFKSSVHLLIIFLLLSFEFFLVFGDEFLSDVDLQICLPVVVYHFIIFSRAEVLNCNRSHPINFFSLVNHAFAVFIQHKFGHIGSPPWLVIELLMFCILH